MRSRTEPTEVALERVVTVGVPAPGFGGTTNADRDEYAADLETVYDSPPDRSWLDAGERVSYADLAEAVAGELGADSGVDMVVTVTPVPDCQARVLPACLLAERLGGQPLVIGINDQGAAGPFTALRLAANRVGAGEARRAALVLMEQSTLPPEAGYALPAQTGAVLLLLGTAPGHRLAEVSLRRIPAAERRPWLRAGYLPPWYAFARQHAERPGGALAVSDRDELLGYDCEARFTPARPETIRISLAGPVLERPTLETQT